MCEVWYCVPGTAIDTSSGMGRRQPMVYYSWASSPLCCMTMDSASEAGFTSGALDCRQVVKLASLVVSCGATVWGQQATNQCHQSMFRLESHTSDLHTYSCPHHVSSIFSFFLILRRMGKNKALSGSSHTSTYQIHVFRFNPLSVSVCVLKFWSRRGCLKA